MKVSELLEIAAGELGVSENPGGSNKVKYNTWYYGKEVSGDAYPWCMVFVQWVFARAKVALPGRTASCSALMNAAKEAGSWVTSGYRPGDILIFDFPGGAATDHCGIMESDGDGVVVSIEGNTSESGSQSNGGKVCRKERTKRRIVGAVRPHYDIEKEENMEKRYNTVEECPQWAQETIKKLCDMGALNGNGEGLDLSYDMVRQMVILDRAGVFEKAK